MYKLVLFIILIFAGVHHQPLQAAILPDSSAYSLEKYLREVEVTERKTVGTRSLFKVMNIGAKPYFSNLTAAGALQQIPSLSADIEGNIRLRGSNKVSLLFEGIPITLFEENRNDLLIQMPIGLFASVLTYNMLPVNMTNEGEAGAVNLIFSPEYSDKPVNKATAAAGSDRRYNASLLAGSRTGKFRWQLGYDYRQEYRYRTYRKTTEDKTGTANMSNNAFARPLTHMAMFNAQHLIGSADFIDFNAFFSSMNYDRLGNINNLKTNTSGSVVANVLRQRNNTEKQIGTSEGIRWKHLWKEQQANLEIVANYDNFDYDQGNTFANKKPGTDVVLAQDRLYITQNKDQWFASVRLTKQFTKAISGQLGYTGQWHNDKYNASDDDLTNNVWLHNAAKSTDYWLNRNLQSGFLEITARTPKMQYAAGIQLQFDARSGHRTNDPAGSEKNNQYLLPHIDMVYRASSFSSWALRYQARINRPLMSDLNPYLDASDATYIHQGNPSLSNEKVHAVELSNTSRIRNLTVNPVLFYRYRTDQIVDVATPSGNTTRWIKENAAHSQDAGLELNLRWRPAPFITTETSATAYRYEIDGSRQGYGIKGKNAIDAKGTLSFKLPFGFNCEIYGYYTDRQLTVQGEIAALGSVGSALSWAACEGRLNLSASIDNLFNSMEEKTIFATMGTQQVIYRNRDARVGWLNVSYRL